MKCVGWNILEYAEWNKNVQGGKKLENHKYACTFIRFFRVIKTINYKKARRP